MIGVGPEINAEYVLTGPDGTRAVFNNPNDADYVGMLTSVAGFDSPDVRESAEDLVGMDGGLHGEFFYGRRPITLEGLFHDHETIAQRNDRMARLQRATSAMRSDATLQWTPEGGVPMFTRIRRQQPLRINGAWVKAFQVALVAADPRIYSTEVMANEVAASVGLGNIGAGFPFSFNLDFGEAPIAGQFFISNIGNTDTYPVYYITGPGTFPSVVNNTNGANIAFFYTLASDEVLIVDTLNRTVHQATKDTGNPSGYDPATATPRYSALDFATSIWGGLSPGTNDIRFNWFSYAAGAKLRVEWRSAWL